MLADWFIQKIRIALGFAWKQLRIPYGFVNTPRYEGSFLILACQLRMVKHLRCERVFYKKYGISRLIVHNEDYVAFFTHKFFIPMIQQIERSALDIILMGAKWGK
jgi:hypothetical protein